LAQWSQFANAQLAGDGFGLGTEKRCDSIRGRTKLVLRVAILLLVGPSVLAADLVVKVTNTTTQTPASGDEVALLTLSQDGMSQSGIGQTDARGRFRFPAVDPGTTHLVRVTHQGVSYHKVADPGVKSVDLNVFEVSNKVDGVAAIMDVQRLEATNDTLVVKQLITMRNQSRPPRTLLNDRTFEIQLPPEAELESGLVQIGEGQPLKEKPLRGDQQGQYYFRSPIRPGDTRFAVVYRVPYNGETWIKPTIRDNQERFVVMLPKSMRFEPQAADVFRPLPDVTPDNVQGTGPVWQGQILSFRISGTGSLVELQGRREQTNQVKQTPRPGGGLGPANGSPDPLYEYRWILLGGFCLVMVGGAVYVMRTTSSPARYRVLSKKAQPSHFPTVRKITHQRRRRSSTVRMN
jgi:hypothetical protein